MGRALLDAWARWIDACDRAAIRAHWYPAQDSTSRMAEVYGERADKRTGKAVEAAPIDYAQTEEERAAAFAKMDSRHHAELCEKVDAYMVELKGKAPVLHLCAVARHRRVIGSVHVGTKRGRNGRRVSLRDGDLADICIKGRVSRDAKLSAFRRNCALVYQGVMKALDL